MIIAFFISIGLSAFGFSVAGSVEAATVVGISVVGAFVVTASVVGSDVLSMLLQAVSPNAKHSVSKTDSPFFILIHMPVRHRHVD